MQRQISLGLGLCLALAPLALACQSQPGTLTTHEHRIQLNAEGCPDRVDPPSDGVECRDRPGKSCVIQKNKLRWTASKAFRIYFDPIEGRPIQSKPCRGLTCETPELVIDRDAPPFEVGESVEYKYTVVVEGCTPLDPPIFIQK